MFVLFEIMTILLRKDLFFSAILYFGLIVSIHEHVSLGGVSVKVAEEKYVSALKRFFHHEFSMVQNRKLFTTGTNPLSVQVLTYQATPIIADNNTIWVQHWDDLKNECVAKELGLLFVAYQIVNHSVHYQRRIGLSRMYSASQDYRLPVRYCFWGGSEVRYYEHFNIIAR